MKKLLSFILVVFFFAIILACLVIYYLGIPYAFYLGYTKLHYAVYLSIWLGIHLIRRIIQNIVLKRRLKQYDQINKILGGK
ncbi:hypothetical protein [Priestia megaterium]|uniref:hypothetical protein n=1 Tax=Priestia megaterium TaxID=1404 RepID=UPI00286018A0|nr:hypothetical protein [Priestia megaterium]MDR7207630.1 hypothetical protein [Priestia megaterium]